MLALVRRLSQPWVLSPTALLASGCYVYTPLGDTRPEPGVEVSIVLTDQARVAGASVLGPSADRVEGWVVDASDSSWRLRVARVIDLHGAPTPWSREPVTLERAWVARVSRRHFSRARTYALAGAFTAAVTAYVATRSFGQGTIILQPPNGGGGGSGQ
ncbi:MAG TPA: hypothetical protein VNA31_01045 [bacterium]|nr:hypothetical protein [bacterium]